MIAEWRRFRNESNIGLNINKSAEITQNGTRKKHFIACREHIRCLWGRLFAKIVLYFSWEAHKTGSNGNRKIYSYPSERERLDAVDLCNGLCEEYKGLSEKEKVHTERMIFLFTGIKPEGCDGGYGGLRETFFRRRFPPASPKVRRPPSKNSLKGYGSNALSRGILPTAKLWCLFEKAPQKSASSLFSDFSKIHRNFPPRGKILPETRG